MSAIKLKSALKNSRRCINYLLYLGISTSFIFRYLSYVGIVRYLSIFYIKMHFHSRMVFIKGSVQILSADSLGPFTTSKSETEPRIHLFSQRV